jgi:glucokinase
MLKAPVTLGIDLGGTKIDIGVVNSQGMILRRELIKTNKTGPDAVLNDIGSAVKKLQLPNEAIESAGVGMAGQIDPETGLVHFAPNLGWKNFPLGEKLQKVLNIPVKVTNDVRAAAWGEWLYGAGKGCNDLICLFVGTGIGAGIVSGGHMLTGSRNAAGEVGHMIIQLNGPLCTCGNRGCFEALAGGWAIARKAKEMSAQNTAEGQKLLNLTGKTLEEISAKNVFEAYEKQSELAIRILEEVKEALIGGVSALAHAFNPAKIILGGGIMAGAPFLIDSIRQGVPKRGLKTNVAFVEIVPAALRGDAGVIGASVLNRMETKS